jgi:hypothetical protein
MASPIVANVMPPVEYTALADVSGNHNVLIPTVCVERLRTLGVNHLTLTLVLNPGVSPRPSMTVTEAAEAHRRQFHWLDTRRAREKISRACSAGQICCRGRGKARRLDADSFATWHARQLIADVSREE